MPYETVFNPTDTSVPVSSDGHSVGGGDWGTVDTREELARAAIERGSLLVAEVGGDVGVLGGAAAEVHEETLRLRALSSQSKQALADVAAEHGIDPGLRKDDLVEQLADAGVDAPAESDDQDDKPKRRRRAQGE